MGRSVTITTPIPTLEEVGKRLKMSKARQRRLIEIVRGNAPVQFSIRGRNGNARMAASQKVGVGSATSKKSKRAAAS
jgi:hypothetical protein